jgi:hypothetical protein
VNSGMQKINIDGIDRDLLTAFVLSRYWGESTAFERMAAVPGGVNPFDAAMSQVLQAEILNIVMGLHDPHLTDNAAIMALVLAHCEGVNVPKNDW